VAAHESKTKAEAIRDGTWRYVDLGAVDAFQNNAQMAVLSRSTMEAGVPTLQTAVGTHAPQTSAGSDDVTRHSISRRASGSACR